MQGLEVVILSVPAILVVAGLFLYLRSTARLDQIMERRKGHAKEQLLHIPPTLHPIIDPKKCMGCAACVSACPEGTIIGLVHGKAELIEAAKCIGHSRCQDACPTDAIELVFGHEEREVFLPDTDGDFETSRPGVYVVGELGGMGLIKNAVTQGVQVASSISKAMNGGEGESAEVDVAIVGGGPAGISTAAACRKAGMSSVILEQNVFGGAVANYPRQKIVMTERVHIPGYGEFGEETISKENLLEGLSRVVKTCGLDLREHFEVTAVEGQPGAFTVLGPQGEVRARRVVLAMGRQGTPRKLGVPGETQSKVAYRLIDPDQYIGSKVLVVGGGDSAVEAACTLAEEGIDVAISYRRPNFSRCKAANQERIKNLQSEGRLQLLLETQVVEITETSVQLTGEDGEISIDNDYVIVCAGGILPFAFLEKSEIEVEKHNGESRKAPDPTKPKSQESVAPPEALVTPFQRRLSLVLFTLGALVVTYLAVRGWDYYTLPRGLRKGSPDHDLLRPSGLIGHGIGIVATAIMLSNFLYVARKRVGIFRKLGSLRSWLSFHVFVGILCPVVIAFHAAFQSNNLLATGTAVSLTIVVVTGLVGRYLYGLLPHSAYGVMSHGDVESSWTSLSEQLDGYSYDSTSADELQAVKDIVLNLPDKAPGLMSAVLRMQVDFFRARIAVRRAKQLFRHPDDYKDFRKGYLLLWKTRLQLSLYDNLRRFMTMWRFLHVTLSIFLVVVMVAHIALSLYLGYGWVFF